MLPSEFIKKYKIKLTEEELQLCRKAMEAIIESKDVIHNESHIYRLFDYLDKFIHTREFENFSENINLKALFVAIVWHDVWKSKRDPKYTLLLFWDNMWEGIMAARYFSKVAESNGLDKNLIKEVKYIIKKHSLFQVLPIKTLEAKIFSDIDCSDALSFDRLYLIEKKYLCDRPIKKSTLNMAKFAEKIFIKSRTDKQFYFQWAKDKFNKKKKDFLKRTSSEIKEYELLLNLLQSKKHQEYERYYEFLFKKYINRPEAEKLTNFF